MTYKEKKEQVREEAIDWKLTFTQTDHYYSEWADYCEYFTKLGKRYGLLKEFRENGII